MAKKKGFPGQSFLLLFRGPENQQLTQRKGSGCRQHHIERAALGNLGSVGGRGGVSGDGPRGCRGGESDAFRRVFRKFQGFTIVLLCWS